MGACVRAYAVCVKVCTFFRQLASLLVVDRVGGWEASDLVGGLLTTTTYYYYLLTRQ